VNRAEILAWARAQCPDAARGVLAELSAQTGLLAASSAGAGFLIDYFEAAVNSAAPRSRLKLVHVAGFMQDSDRKRRRKAALRRREALESLFKANRGFDLAGLRRMYDRAFAGGVEDFFPVASVEWEAASGRFAEVSLYSDERPAELARALNGDLGRGLDLPRVYAVGYDFRPGKPSRFKLYHRRAGGMGARASGRPFLALPRACLPDEHLVLRRRPDGGRLEDARKVYLCYLSPEASRLDCRVSVLARACAPGPLKRFLESLEASAGGQWLDYIGCEKGTFEAYVARPAWRAGLKRAPGKGARLWVLP